MPPHFLRFPFFFNKMRQATLGRGAGVQVAAADVRKPRELRVEKSHVEDLPAPGLLSVQKRRENSHGRIHPAGHVRDGNGIAHRPARGFAAAADDPCFGVTEDVVAGHSRLGAGDAEAGDATIDAPSICRTKSSAMTRYGFTGPKAGMPGYDI